MTASTNPNEWHQVLVDVAGACPLCGFAGVPDSQNRRWRRRNWHRAVAPEENLAATWLVRKTSKIGWREHAVFAGKAPKPRDKAYRDPLRIPSRRVAELLGKAAAHVAHGRSITAAAELLGVKRDQINDWRARWKETWEQLLDRASKSLLVAVRAAAGTSEVLENPDRQATIGRFLDRRARTAGRELFPPPDGQTTLTTFYQSWYLSRVLFDAAEKTKKGYATAVASWRIITGDPPATAVTNDTLALFRDALLSMNGRRPAEPMSVNTVRSKLRHVGALLTKLGPPGPGNREALAVLDKVPWCRPPREARTTPKMIPLDDLSACYAAAGVMERPLIPGVDPPTWWRALFVVAWNLGGLRTGTIFALRWEDVDWQRCQVVIPAASMKARRPKIVPLNAGALQALRSIRTDRKIIFRPAARSFAVGQFNRLLHKLQSAAGLPPERYFGLQNLRQSVATVLFETNPGAASFALGHSALRVTREHYVNGDQMLRRALEFLPAFTAATVRQQTLEGLP